MTNDELPRFDLGTCLRNPFSVAQTCSLLYRRFSICAATVAREALELHGLCPYKPRSFLVFSLSYSGGEGWGEEAFYMLPHPRSCKGGRFLTRALHFLAIFRHALRTHWQFIRR